MKRKHNSEDIRTFIIENLDDFSFTIVSLIAATFKITRQSAHEHIKKLQKEGLIESRGSTKNTSYHFRKLFE